MTHEACDVDTCNYDFEETVSQSVTNKKEQGTKKRKGNQADSTVKQSAKKQRQTSGEGGTTLPSPSWEPALLALEVLLKQTHVASLENELDPLPPAAEGKKTKQKSGKDKTLPPKPLFAIMRTSP